MVLSALGLAACGGDDDASAFSVAGRTASDSPSGENAGAAPSGGTSSGGSSTSSGGIAAPPSPNAPSSDETPGAQAGLLTAGVWDDNLNFEFYKKYIGLSSNLAGLPSFSITEREQARAQWTARGAKTELDIAFLLDTTGSMGDELKYIQKEIDGIAQSIKDKHPQMTARFGLVLYRDHGDAYLTRELDFTGLDEFKAKLDEQSVGGGGDYPEAVEEGLAATLKLSWRAGSVARMAFWVADAPHHHGDEGSVKDSILGAAAKDVHIYPVAASGSDERTEFTMRTAAQMTGGRYVFLTDDSGVGNAHAEPKIPCYHVTRFDGALVRMVESELTGQHVQPDAKAILRSVGNPVNGQCATKSSGTVSIY
ncbi:MAG: VWA domain-containing protein [Labilithrix sp.]|nr:VWA domain-containing protein [Labilithrix sp.]MCW5815957.1 VWA domain-containing protein [Labilithrix sp.]